MGYTAGTLGVEILNGQNTITAIQQTANAITKLSNATEKLSKVELSTALNNIEQIFSKIAVATKSIDNTNLKNFAKSATALSNLTKIEKIGNINFTKVGEGFRNLSVAIDPFLNKIKSAETSLVSLSTITSNKKLLKTNISSINNTNKKQERFYDIAILSTVINLAKKLSNVMLNITQAGQDYTETLNLWETAMGKNIDRATVFVDKLNEAYGISEKTLMNAQAIFKNMLGSLGQISDAMAYQLSEGITQMALDYASLYNQTFEQAFTKFQAALSGQVRPIRSVAGYDITENTLYQLYQSLGGTKTVRQLSRTEKQLLSILAIFKQMSASGAIGDLDKTMESYANQSRVMAESWQQVKTYAGVVLTHIIAQSGALTVVNGVLMAIGDALKFYAESTNAIQHFGGDPFASLTDNAENATEAIDKLNGKLLNFDKIRAMNTAEDQSGLNLDNLILKEFGNYGSILENADMEARKLADSILRVFGITRDANGELQGTQFSLNAIKSLIDSIIIGIIAISGLGVAAGIARIVELISKLNLSFGKVGLIAISVVGAFQIFNNALKNLDGPARTILSVLSAIVGVLGIIYGFKQGGWVGAIAGGIGIGALLAGIINTSQSVANIPKYANGASNIDSGTLFVAGEMGRTETVYTGSNGKTNVANIQQMRSAYIGALKEWWSTAKHEIPQFREVSKTGIYQVAKDEMVRRGEW